MKDDKTYSTRTYLHKGIAFILNKSINNKQNSPVSPAPARPARCRGVADPRGRGRPAAAAAAA